MYTPQTSLVMSGAFTNPYGKFPVVGALQASADPSLGLQHGGDEALPRRVPSRDRQGDPASHGGAEAGQVLRLPGHDHHCAALQMFVAGANAAGADLTPEKWLKGLESVGKIELAAAPESSFGPGKPDGQDSFQLVKFNPAWTPTSGVQQFIPVGAPITLG